MAEATRTKSVWKLPSFRGSTPARPPPSLPTSSPTDSDVFSDPRPLRPAGEADIVVILPNHAAHFVPCPPDPHTGKPVPGPSRLMGEVELRIPEGGRRVKAVQLIRRDFTWLNLADPDGWKILDEAVTELQGELNLSEGVHRFSFNELLPSTLTFTCGWHGPPLPQTGTYLFVQAIGAKPEDYPGHDLLDLSNLPLRSNASENTPPTYSSTGSATKLDERPWLEHTISHWRSLFVEPDISPNGDHIRLDDRFDTIVPDLGIIQCRSYAENLSIAGPLVTRFRILSPSPKATIIAVRTILLQNEATHTPGAVANRPVKVSRCVTIGDYEYKSPVTDVLWRGLEAGGTDEGSFEWTKHGRFPMTDTFWWSSIPGTHPPLEIEHTFVHEIYFSVYGQDVYGNEMDTPGPGSVRLARRAMKLFMPSCSAVPGIRGLPTYDTDVGRADMIKPCPACGKEPGSNICQKCPSARLPHIAHEKGPSYCATCSGRSLVPRDPRNRDFFRCACADHVAWTAAGCPDEGLRIPEDEADSSLAATARNLRRDEMTAVKVNAEWSRKW